MLLLLNCTVKSKLNFLIKAILFPKMIFGLLQLQLSMPWYYSHETLILNV